MRKTWRYFIINETVVRMHLQKYRIRFFFYAASISLLLPTPFFLCTHYIYTYNYISEESKMVTRFDRFPCVIVIRPGGGRLGNRMFLFASAYGLASWHMCGLHIESDLFNNLSAIFRIKLSNIVTKREVDRIGSIKKQYNVCEFFPNLRRPNSIRYLELDGYWQTYKNFIEYADEIKKQFMFITKVIRTAVNFFAFHMKKRSFFYEVRYLYTRLKNTGKDDIQKVLKALITSSDATWVGIHIRRTDIMYQKVEASPAYIYAAMDFFRTRYSRTLFVIGSDDKQYCVENFGNLTDVILTSPSFSPAEDLAILSICQHTIVTAGTFGWWAAFLAGGDTLHDNKYLSNITGTDNNCAKEDYYLPSFLVPIQPSPNHNESVSPENQTYIFKRVSVLMRTKL